MSGGNGARSNGSLSAPRLFVRDPLAAGGTVRVEAHYLAHVLRRRAGDPVRLFNGADGEWLARIADLGKREAALGIEARLRDQAPEPDIWLVAAPLRRDLTELVVQKATELGAAEIRFVRTARTQPFRLNLPRLEAIAIEAAEQSERLTVPALREAVALERLLADWPAGRNLAVALERSEPAPWPDAGALLIGSEGGFAPAEREMLGGAPFARPVSLGSRILRAETAAIAGLALLLCKKL